MNGYKMVALNYQALMKAGLIEEEIAEKEIRIYEFLADCDVDDILRMVDSSAFNDIIKFYMNTALYNAGFDEGVREEAYRQLRLLFDEKTAREVYYN